MTHMRPRSSKHMVRGWRISGSLAYSLTSKPSATLIRWRACWGVGTVAAKSELARHPPTTAAVAKSTNIRFVSVEIVAGGANFPKCVFFFLSPRRRRGERIKERGIVFMLFVGLVSGVSLIPENAGRPEPKLPGP